MGRKVHPYGFRLGYITDWRSKWYAGRNYTRLLLEDVQLRKYVKEKLYSAGVAFVEIKRAAEKISVDIHTARPGIVIGKKGAGVESLKMELQRFVKKGEIFVNIHEVSSAELDAQLVSEAVALQLEKRVAFRRAMKRAITTAMKIGAQGIKIRCSGRLGGAEMARTEWYCEGKLPLQMLRANIDYGYATAETVYGIIGVKVWIYKGEIIPGLGKTRV